MHTIASMKLPGSLTVADAVIYAGAVVVETESVSVAATVAAEAGRADAVRGAVVVGGRSYRWSTIQQYERHGGFVATDLHRR